MTLIITANFWVEIHEENGSHLGFIKNAYTASDQMNAGLRFFSKKAGRRWLEILAQNKTLLPFVPTLDEINCMRQTIEQHPGLPENPGIIEKLLGVCSETMLSAMVLCELDPSSMPKTDEPQA